MIHATYHKYCKLLVGWWVDWLIDWMIDGLLVRSHRSAAHIAKQSRLPQHSAVSPVWQACFGLVSMVIVVGQLSYCCCSIIYALIYFRSNFLSRMHLVATAVRGGLPVSCEERTIDGLIDIGLLIGGVYDVSSSTAQASRLPFFDSLTWRGWIW